MDHPSKLIADMLPSVKEVREAATAAGCTWQHLNHVRLGHRRLSREAADRLATFLQGRGHAVTPAQLLGVASSPAAAVGPTVEAALVVLAKARGLVEVAEGMLRDIKAA